MTVESETEEVHAARRTALELLFSEHVGDCLAPCNRLCPLGMNIPAMLRQVQAGQFAEAIATVREALPMPAVLGRLCHHPCEQGCRRGTWDDAAAIRDLERFVADWDLGEGQRPKSDVQRPKSDVRSPKPEVQSPKSKVQSLEPDVRSGVAEDGISLSYLPARKPATGKSVAIIGAGPAGLAAAYFLLRQGHACTVADRHENAGGSLRRQVNETALPREVLDAEIRQLERLGAQFRLGAELGRDVTLEGLLRGFDAVLITAGEVSKAEGEALGIEMAPGGIKIQAETFQTSRRGVFAAGRAVKPLSQLVRAMSEGQAAAQCIHEFLCGREAQRPGKPFSSLMGRLDKDELSIFLRAAGTTASVAPCDACAGFNATEAAAAASRCLHCDCRSSGHCALQHYGQVYGVNASRFRMQRGKFEQFAQPGGVIFEPGKCIRCGICVKLTEAAREPLGLAFIGRGFDVRVATPFNHTIAEGLQTVAEECVRCCPTGALAFDSVSKEQPAYPFRV
jgi:NADPH-dependent glutamate synthase beta subunit-like oxidoreductase/ferredoxin